jgi:CheY-like chemotaxis protein
MIENLDVREASDGLEALRLVKAWSPELVLLDMGLPGLTGLEAAPAIRKLSPGTRLVAVTAAVLDDDLAALRRAGIADVVGKPFRAEDLFATVARVLEVPLSAAVASGPAVPPAEQPPGRELPLPLRRALSQAAREADVGRIEALATELSALSSVLATRVLDAAARYDYDEIIRLADDGAAP